ncbi:CHAD domain-containing protein [Corallincola spongiicola]|uniref:CHAD domain-containing protein n=2 Tax=Corallincola spongiicola TaxID=2520508 RepID=A0ABY1WNZ7_9GAMM|nr:CHAD domain-containing protein [Corallincola spongiicola]
MPMHETVTTGSRLPRIKRQSETMKNKQKRAVQLPPLLAKQSLILLATAQAQQANIFRSSTRVEGLHDYRVALRKLRSLVTQMKKLFPDDCAQRLNQQLGLMARKTNTLRDMDVYQQQWQHYQKNLSRKQRQLLAKLTLKEKQRQQRERARVIAWLSSKNYQRTFASIQHWFALAEQEAIAEVAPSPSLISWLQKQMNKRYQVIRAAAQALHEPVADEQLHALRIQGKKLRYLVELFPQASEKTDWELLHKPLKKLQSHLGNVNDCAVQLQGIRRKQARLMQQQYPHQAATLNALLEVKKQIKQQARTEKAAALKLLAALQHLPPSIHA